jgi:hypothetical protein
VKLTFEYLDLELDLAQRAQSAEAYEDWCRLVVRVRVPGFSGKFDWSATISDLQRLTDVLRQFHEGLGSEMDASFDPLEPNVALTFRSDKLGHIAGEYTFDALLGEGPRLTGSFHFDQSYLPHLINELEQLLLAAAAA